MLCFPAPIPTGHNTIHLDAPVDCPPHKPQNLLKPDYGPSAAPPSSLKPHEDRVSPLQRGVHREIKQVRALAVALAELCLSVALSVHLPRAPAGPEILVQHDGALGLDISTYEQLSERRLHYQTYYYITYEQALKNRSTNFWRKISASGGVAEPKILTKNICPIRYGNFADRTRRNIWRKNVGWHFSSSLASSSISEIAVTDWVH